jgi:hypothetical protein
MGILALVGMRDGSKSLDILSTEGSAQLNRLICSSWDMDFT